MMLLAVFSLALLFVGSAGSWISVPLPSGAWVAVLVASPGRRFLLHPQARAQRFNATNSSSALLEVRFWRSRDLRLVEGALRERQLCDPAESCRVEPYQARRLTLRDLRGLWRPLRSRRLLAVTLPPVMRFVLLRAINSSNPETSVSDLSGLVLEMTGVGGRGRELDVAMEIDLSRLEDSSDSQSDVETEVDAIKEEVRLREEVLRLRAAILKSRESGATAISPPLERMRGVTAVSDCADVRLHGLKTGVYYLRTAARKVVCSSDGALVVLSRTDGSLNFNRNWMQYRRGFGNFAQGSNFFLGLDVISNYTATGDRCMTLSLQPMSSALPLQKARYSQFTIAPESERFQLSYKKFDGGLTFDSFSHHNGQKFYTPDRSDSDTCAKRFKSGNWFDNCNHINVFGRYNYTKKPHDGFFSNGLSKEKPRDYFLLRSAFMTLHKAGGDPRALSPVSGVPSPSCPSRVLEWTAPETAEYLITAGGAPGGAAPHGNSPSGGRGALVKMRTLLKAGSKLRLIIGCQGGVGQLSGGGGDATFVADMKRQVLLVAAGGGGGGGWTSGGPGRASENGGRALPAPGVSKDVLKVAATGWHSIKAKIFGSVNEVVSSGAPADSQHRGGGGGGGFNGGWGAADGGLSGERQSPRHSAGGGGGSVCNEKFAESCEMKEGGNERGQGVLKIEAYRCF